MDEVILNLVKERDRLFDALIDMVESYQSEGSMENPALLKAKKALEKSGVNFDEYGDIIKE